MPEPYWEREATEARLRVQDQKPVEVPFRSDGSFGLPTEGVLVIRRMPPRPYWVPHDPDGHP